MTDLSEFYFDQYAINFLTQLILTLATTLYLLSLKNKTTATRWFILFFAGMTVYAGVSVIEAASFWVRRYYAVYFQLIALSLALAALMQFAYRFPQRSEKDDPPLDQRREATLVPIRFS